MKKRERQISSMPAKTALLFIIACFFR